ncbi:hypothetical protein [Flavobacterium lacus]|uniref:Uncharacterized protein n=1 Tax=Flavobacterium lacus TaxID=1353778 RepID=A0A328WUT9_9FLAO|nr:hypothetical protein [Flavobacterium lacus]RAR47138.1 hypothetical protein B0I10_11146 [Flavobacterium lacus]
MDAKFYKFLYGGFVLFGLYYAIFSKNFGDAAMMLGIALAFDPFNKQQAFNERPIWQKAWLIVHLVLVFTFFGVSLFKIVR